MKKYLTLILIFACSLYELHATIRYVKFSSIGTGTGSWANASNDLQTMINASSAGDEIWVASGVYKPTYQYPAGCTGCGASGTSNRNNTFFLKSGVKLYGGFAGTETSILQRNYTLNETILSGDISTVGLSSDNVYHVVTAVNCDNTTLLDKFTIQDGNANGAGSITVGGKTYYQVWGGGMVSISSSVRIQNCSFVNNVAESGGGMLNSDGSSPTIYNSVFANNTADGGGGVYNHDFSSPTFNNCTIAYNTGTIAGGAMYNYNGSQAAYNRGIIWGNTGATFSGIANNSGSLSVIESIIQEGSSPCTSCPNTNGNIDPLFVNTTDLNGTDNRWGNADDGLMPSLCSSAIDAAGSGIYLSLDIAGQNRFFDVPFRQNFSIYNVDLGAYENQSTVPTKVYVNNALTTGANNGTTWADAFRSPTTALQDALNAACVGNEIWVAAGTYKPSAYPSGCTGCSSNRDYTFLLKNEVKIYGGFLGTETTLGQRKKRGDAGYIESVLSGDIGTVADVTDNVYHIAIATNNNNNTVLDGFFIADGGTDLAIIGSNHITLSGNDLRRNYGGGVLLINSSPTINNCFFYGNLSSLGSAINIARINTSTNYTPTVSNCLFIANNSSDYAAGISSASTNTTIENCTFENNNAARGTAIYLSNAVGQLPQIKKCIFLLNYAQTVGGAIYNNGTDTSPNIENCLFIRNQSSYGAAIYNEAAVPNIANCTFSGNTSTTDIGVNNYSPIAATTTIKNSIFWNATPSALPAIVNSGSSISNVSNSIVQGGYSGCVSCPNTNGNINPQFINIADPNGIDNKYPTYDDGLALLRTSPAIDAGTDVGTPPQDILGNSKFVHSDIGAYEFMPKDICINKRYIADAPIETGTHIGTQNIISIGTVGSGTSVVFDSPSITLLPGFQTQNNAVFSTIYVGCIEAIYSK